MTHFFVSYTQADREWAEWIAWQLEDAGHETVLQAWDFPPGSNFVHEMQQAAARAERTVAVLSPAYLSSEFASAEWYAAFREDPVGEERRLLPVRVRECDPAGLLGSVVYVNLVGREEQAARAALLAAVGNEARSKPSMAPPFPGAAGPPPARPRFPGSLPPTWNVPYARNPNFTGRDDLLTETDAVLGAGSRAAFVQNAQAIHGLGGVGKTQIAVEYAYRHAGDYDAVWWVRAEDPATLSTDYASLAGELGLPGAGTDAQALIVEAMRRWLEREERRWLLVFDNADGPTALDPYLPRTGRGHVLITSRNPTWPARVRPLAVPVLSAADAVAFLLHRTGQTDSATAAVLAEELGFFLLALEQAAAHVDARALTLAGYLERFRAQRPEVLARGDPTDYPATVATTWELSFRAAAEQAPGAADLLNLVAFFAPDAIPLEMLAAHAASLPEPLRQIAGDPTALDDAVVALRRYSLVEAVDVETLSVHPLVQAVVRDRLGDDKATWARTASAVLLGAFPTNAEDVRVWPVAARLQPHALQAANHAAELGIEDATTGRLLNDVGMYLAGRAQFKQAHAVRERALAIGERVYGPDHPIVAIRLNNLALSLYDDGDLAGAREMFKRALAVLKGADDRDPALVAATLSNLGGVLRALSDLGGAKQHFVLALAIFERIHGPDHPRVAIGLSNVAEVLREQGDPVNARQLLQRALFVSEQALGHNHPDVAVRLCNLAGALKDQGDLVGARAMLERALAIDEAAYGPDHPQVAVDLSGLAGVMREVGELVAAGQLLSRAVQILTATLGDYHRDVAGALCNLADVQIRQGTLAQARGTFQRALPIWRRIGDDPSVQAVLHSLRSIDEQERARRHPSQA